jgi:hypothetical protein
MTQYLPVQILRLSFYGIFKRLSFWAVESCPATLYFKFDGAVTPIIPTCDITNFDNNVTLPDVRRADLVNHGAGRYTGVTKEFNINLACENTPKVTVKFNGDKCPVLPAKMFW